MAGKQIVIVGGSVAGMATGLALSQAGHCVTLLEREALPECATPLEAFERWERRGSPQCHHSHAFLARLHNAIRDRAPQLHAALFAAGAEELRFDALARDIYRDPVFVPEDDEIVMLACRRITFDWVLRRHLKAQPGVTLCDDADVVGLEAERDRASGLPRVTGVRVAGSGATGEVIDADLVVDATGRRTRIGSWLTGIGAPEPRVETEPCGIFYCSRFYRLLDGVEPPPVGAGIGADLGYMKYAIFPGDSRIFSVTLAASPEDGVLRKVLQPAAFEAAASMLPVAGAWIDPAVSEPITGVYAFADLKNTRRFFVDAGQPLALDLFPIGDALVHANPLSGRGCTLAWVGAELLADALAEHPDDPRAFALALDAGVGRELVPWYEDMRRQDRNAIEVNRLLRAGDDPFRVHREDGSVDPKGFIRSLLREGLVPAMREDIVVLRAFMRIFNMLESPRNLLENPQFVQRVLAVWQRRGEREPLRLGPGRKEMVDQLNRAAA